MALAKLLGVSYAHHAAIPGASCRWLAVNSAAPPSDTLVCADPVHLIAGSDDAQLIPIQRLELSQQESRDLLTDLNEVLIENSCSFLHDNDGNWYYQGLNAESLMAAPPSAVEGHPMTAALPRSKEARAWRSLWSETQMVLHQSSVNQARQARGEPTINSVWFWGGGELPVPVDQNDTLLYADDDFAQGLAQALGVRCLSLDACASINFADPTIRHHVVVDMTLMNGNPDFIEQRDHGAHWCERLTALLAANVSAEAELNGLTGCRSVFVPSAAKSSSVLARLAKMFQ